MIDERQELLDQQLTDLKTTTKELSEIRKLAMEQLAKCQATAD
jgi:hypothetical protein